MFNFRALQAMLPVLLKAEERKPKAEKRAVKQPWPLLKKRPLWILSPIS